MMMQVDKLTVHPVAELVPRMKPDEWEGFLASVKAHGVVEPIVVQDGVILDGRHRWEAAVKCGQETIPAREVQLTPYEQMIHIATSCAQRRHLTEDQRAMAGAYFLEELNRESRKERARKAGKAGGRGRGKK